MVGRDRWRDIDDATFQAAFAEYLHKRRNEEQMSQDALGASARVSEKTVREFEKKTRGVPRSGSSFQALVKALDGEDEDGGPSLERFEKFLLSYASSLRTNELENASGNSEPLRGSDNVGTGLSSRRKALTLASFVPVASFFGLAIWWAANSYFSPDQSATRELARRNIPITTETVKSALQSGDVEILSLMAMSSLSLAQVEGGLRIAGLRFMNASKGRDGLVKWLGHAFDMGLDPEFRVVDEDQREISLFHAAFLAGNTDAAITLLEHGASPHGYQEILGEGSGFPFFLDPAFNTIKSTHLSSEDKERFLNGMLDSGAVFYSRPIDPRPFREDVADAARAQGEFESTKAIMSLTGRQPQQVEYSCKFTRKRQVCEAQSDRDGQNWCAVMDAVPKAIANTDFSFPLISLVYVQDMIAISGGSAFFYVMHFVRKSAEPGILEVPPSADRYNLYLYGRRYPDNEGICQDKENDWQSNCWRKWPLNIKDDGSILIADFYTTQTVNQCPPSVEVTKD